MFGITAKHRHQAIKDDVSDGGSDFAPGQMRQTAEERLQRRFGCTNISCRANDAFEHIQLAENPIDLAILDEERHEIWKFLRSGQGPLTGRGIAHKLAALIIIIEIIKKLPCTGILASLFINLGEVRDCEGLNDLVNLRSCW